MIAAYASAGKNSEYVEMIAFLFQFFIDIICRFENGENPRKTVNADNVHKNLTGVSKQIEFKPKKKKILQ